MWSTNTLEPLKGQDLSIADKLLDYGCWCQIRNQSGGFFTGHGTPVDALDLACKSWYQCKACTTIDFSACSPRAGYQIDFHPITQRIDCTSNSSECSVRILLKFRSEKKYFFFRRKTVNVMNSSHIHWAIWHQPFTMTITTISITWMNAEHQLEVAVEAMQALIMQELNAVEIIQIDSHIRQKAA